MNTFFKKGEIFPNLKTGHGFGGISVFKFNFHKGFLNDTPYQFEIILHPTGAVEPTAQGYSFAHPLFKPQLRKLQILRTHFFGTH